MARTTEVSVGLSRDRYHRYRWMGGTPLPGTTGILRIQDSLQGGDGLTTWAARTAVDKLLDLGGHEAARDEAVAAINDARDIGSEVHEAMDAMLGGQPLEPTPRVMPYYYGIAAFLAKERPVTIAREQMVVNLTAGYGGTFDWACEIRGGLALIDFKTGKGKPSHSLQLAAYSAGEFIGKPDDPMKYEMPEFTAHYVLLLRPGELAELVPVRVGDREREHFLYLAEVYHRLKAYEKPEQLEVAA
jgi:hypothetical protein